MATGTLDDRATGAFSSYSMLRTETKDCATGAERVGAPPGCRHGGERRLFVGCRGGHRDLGAVGGGGGVNPSAHIDDERRGSRAAHNGNQGGECSS